MLEVNTGIASPNICNQNSTISLTNKKGPSENDIALFLYNDSRLSLQKLMGMPYELIYDAATDQVYPTTSRRKIKVENIKEETKAPGTFVRVDENLIVVIGDRHGYFPKDKILCDFAFKNLTLLQQEVLKDKMDYLGFKTQAQIEEILEQMPPDRHELPSLFPLSSYRLISPNTQSLELKLG